jgi:phosphatidylglycerophosphatase A
VCGIGKIPFAPGTFGSLFGVGVFILLSLFSANLIDIIKNFFTDNNYKNTIIILAFLSIMLILFIIGVWASSRYANSTGNNDPKEVVIDEVVGQLIVLFFTTPIILNLVINNKFLWFILMYVGPFIAFRMFDIVKPWPIKWLDKNIKGGFGIMLDDVMAAFMAIIVYNGIIFYLIDHKII